MIVGFWCHRLDSGMSAVGVDSGGLGWANAFDDDGAANDAAGDLN
jgi:hypothetical protein